MKLHIQGKGPIELTQHDFLAEGGQARVYTKDKTAYKIYLNPKEMIPVGKIQELSVITNKNVIKPQDILLDSHNKPVGYTMDLVKNTYSLCQLFPKAFRNRNNLSPDKILQLVRDLQNLIQSIHDHKILIVDLNELNFLVGQDFKNIYAIDVDSYGTPHFPPTAISDKITDVHSKDFSELTDWFSFAVLAFQMFISISPYRGSHPTIKSVEERMKKNISVLNPDVSIPACCYSFDVIPDIYKQWFAAVLDGGKRFPPPNDLLAPIANIINKIKTVVRTDQFLIEELQSFAHDIISVLYKGANKAILTTGGLYLNKDIFPNVDLSSKIVTTPKTNCVIAASIENEKLKLFNVTRRQDLDINYFASEMMEYNNKIYIKNTNKILEIEFNEFVNGNILASAKTVGHISENSTSFYDGVVIQNLLGTYYASIFPNSGGCYQIKLRELEGYRQLEAKFDNNVLMITGLKGKNYDKLIFKFNESYNSYSLRKIEDVQDQNINFVVLDSGVCVHILEDGILELFRNDVTSNSIKIIKDPEINTDVILMKNSTKLLFAKENKLYSMAMK